MDGDKKMKFDIPKIWLRNPELSTKQYLGDFALAIFFLALTVSFFSGIIWLIVRNILLSIAIAEGLCLLGYVVVALNWGE